MSIKETIKRYLMLAAGIFIMGLGVALARRSGLGTSPISSVANVLSMKFEALTLGTWVAIWNCLLVLVEIAILGREFKLRELLQFPLSLLLGSCTDVGMSLTTWLVPGNYIARLALIFSSVIVVAVGVTLAVSADTVMNVGEAFTKVMSNKLHRSFGGMKVAVDAANVLIAVVLSLILFKGSVVGVREGTVITALVTGFVVKWLSKRIKTPLEALLK